MGLQLQYSRGSKLNFQPPIRAKIKEKGELLKLYFTYDSLQIKKILLIRKNVHHQIVIPKRFR